MNFGGATMSKEQRISDLERQIDNLIRHVERLERERGADVVEPPAALSPLRAPQMFRSA
jgi:hypothetical protein